MSDCGQAPKIDPPPRSKTNQEVVTPIGVRTLRRSTPNGVGKSTIARNIAHQAVLQGHTALFTSAGQLLGDLAAIDSASALRRRLSHCAAPALLIIDEVGYLS